MASKKGIGRYRHPIEIQAKIVPAKRDSYGAEVPVWTTVACRDAAVEPLSGRELFQAQQVRPDVTHKISMRSFVTPKGERLNPEMRARWGNRYFNIDAALNPGERYQGTEVVLLAKEEVGSAVQDQSEG